MNIVNMHNHLDSSNDNLLQFVEYKDLGDSWKKKYKFKVFNLRKEKGDIKL